MESVRRLIYQQVAERKISQQEAKTMLLKVRNKSRQMEDIAIVGMAGRFPGANHLDAFWDNLIHRRCSIGRFPETRRHDINRMLKSPYFRQLVFGSSRPIDPEEQDLYMPGGYLDQIDQFDASFFNIPPVEATFMSPHQRLMLETAWMALEDAGYTKKEISDTKTGVFIGFDHTEIPLYKYITLPSVLHETGSYPSILASRISYILNLKGPAFVLDSACSSSLVALHLACKAIKNGECENAVVGGIFLLMKNFKATYSSESNLGMVTSDGDELRAFDKKATGTLWGEAVTAVFVKPLSSAIAGKDHIYAVIKGSAFNNDGLSNGITAPSAKAQEEVLVNAWQDAGVNPETLSHIETHGTGTILGDPIEIKGMTQALTKYTGKKQYCSLGTLKPNIGHSVSASGLAAVIKVILMLKHGIIPANICMDEVNPFIDLSHTPLYFNDRVREWKRKECPRRAGVSAFGFSGTNCHLVLEEAPVLEKKKETQTEGILTLSAADEQKLKTILAALLRKLDAEKELSVTDLCFSSNVGREHSQARVAMVVNNKAQLRGKIKDLYQNGFRDQEQTGVYSGSVKIVVESKKNRKKGEITQKEAAMLSRQANHLVENEKFTAENAQKLCRFYVSGANIDWRKLYEKVVCRKISLPPTPRNSVRYWASIPAEALEADPIRLPEKETNTSPGRLIGKCLSNSMDEAVFLTEFSTERFWVASEHKLVNQCVIPATAQLDMVMEAVAELQGKVKIQLKNVVFFQPMVVEEYETKQVHTIIIKHPGYDSFKIASLSDADENEEAWVLHSQGDIYPGGMDEKHIHIEEALRKFEEFEIKGFQTHSLGNLSFGDRWKNIEAIYSVNGRTLIHQKLPERYIGDLKTSIVHPSLMDNAVNAMIEYVEKGLDGMYLPFSYGEIQVVSPLSGELYSIISEKPVPDTSLRSYDVAIYGKDGKLLVDVKNYSLRRVDALPDIPFGYKRTWMAKPRGTDAREEEVLKNPMVVFTDSHASGADFVRHLRGRGVEVFHIALESRKEGTCADSADCIIAAKDMEQGIKQALQKTNGMQGRFFVSCVDAFERSPWEDAEQSMAFLALFQFLKALANHSFHGKVCLSVLINQSIAVTGEECLHPYHAAMGALCRVFEQETPPMSVKCIDWDGSIGLDALVKEIITHQTDSTVYYRNRQRFIEVFDVLDTKQVREVPNDLQKEGVYIITGGLGGIGFTLAKSLTARRPINLALINRKTLDRKKLAGMPEGDLEDSLKTKLKEISNMEANGSVIDCIACDVTDRERLSETITALRKKYGRINGVVHSAGVAGKGFIYKKDLHALTRVLAPKVDGTVNLDELTRADRPDFFIIFSSITSIVGGQGQGDYAAANAFVDAYAQKRNKLGLGTLCINWPAWKEVGMAAEHGYAQDDTGIFRAMDPKEGLLLFERLIKTDIKQCIPVAINFSAAMHSMDPFPFRLSDRLMVKIRKLKTNTAHRPESSGKKVVISGSEDDHYSEIQEKLAMVWGRVLGVEEIDIYENFHGLGGDSMLAAGLIKELDILFPGVVNIVDVFSYPSIAQLAEHIEQSMGGNGSQLPQEDRNDKKEQAPGEPAEDERLKEMLRQLESGQGNPEDTLAQLQKTFQED